MATIRKRQGPHGRSVWQAQIIRLGFPSKYHTFDTKGEADAWARRVESEMDTGLWEDRSEADRTTVAEALERYLLEITPRKAPRTRQWDRWKAGSLKKGNLARISLSRVAGRDVADHIRTREAAGISAATIIGELSLLSNLYTVAKTVWGMGFLVNPVPLAKAARPRTPSGRERRLQGDEEEQLLAAASPRFRYVILFAIATTMRKSEIANLCWDQLDLKRRCLILSSVHTKNRTARSVPLSPVALEILHSIPRRLDGSVFGMTSNAIKLAWQRVIRKTGIQDLHFHDLRHEGISRLFEDTDLDMMEIRAISGHKTLQMLARYTHLRTHRLADRLAGAKR